MSGEMHFQGNALPEPGGDLFGFTPVANQVASAVLEQTGTECFVLGLEGDWGSGKSSLLAILERRLREKGASTLRFEPWMIGSREALLAELFAGLEKAVAEQEAEEGNATRKTTRGAKSALERLQSYSGRVAALGRMAGLAGILVPYMGVLEGPLTKAAEALKPAEQTPLADLKAQTSEALKQLSRRIVVLIDDLDRLEPRDAVEVLRLVQSAADFPNVTYVLCYDRSRLAESVTTTTGVADGASFLEKIVQLVVPVPYPQPSSLRDMFIRRLKALTGRDEVSDRLAKIIFEHVGPRLRTPRAVVRSIDTLRLLWPALNGQVDLDDLVWLQFVRAEDERLYRWIEAYAAETAYAPADYQELQALRERLGEALKEILEATAPWGVEWPELREFLPMIDPSGGSELTGSLFVQPQGSISTYAFHKARLSSPDHSRLYFGLIRPDGAMTNAELTAFLHEIRDPDRVAAKMLELAHATSRAGATKLEIVLDQLVPSLGQLDDEEARGFVTGLLGVADELISNSAVSDPQLLRKSLSALLERIAERVDGGKWSEWLLSALVGVRALNFVAAEVDDRAEALSTPWSGADPTPVSHYLASAFAKLGPKAIVQGSRPGKILRIWKMADAEGRRAFLDVVYADDELLSELVVNLHVRTVEASGFREMGELVFKDTLREYWEQEPIAERLESIVKSVGEDGQALAKALATLREAEARWKSSTDEPTPDATGA